MSYSARHLTASSSTSTVRPPQLPRSPAPSQSRPQHSVRTHLADLLPHRHALFHVRLTVHQLWNVPLVSGEFSVKWKFNNVQPVRGPGLRARMKASASAMAPKSGKGKGKGKDRIVGGESTGDASDNGNSNGLLTSDASMLSVPSEGSSSSSPKLPNNALSPVNGTDGSGDTVVEFSQESRGRTGYVKLREHNVKWGHTVNVLLQMDVHRETAELQASDLKLTVDQLVIPGDPDAPRNPRFGVLNLNLAEYVDEGPVTRRYLLRQSKTNATLQLTIEMVHFSGEKTYKSPPLRKGEVMAGVATLLENSPYRTLPRPSNNSRVTSNRSGTGLSLNSRTSSSANSQSTGMHSLSPNITSTSSNSSISTTDNIIEAIFNPVPTSSTLPSPFTYYVSPKVRPPSLDLVGSPDENSSGGIDLDAPRSAISGSSANISIPDEHCRGPRSTPSISTRSEISRSTSASRSSADKPPRQRWWQKLGHGHSGHSTRSRPESPLPQSSPSAQSHSLPTPSRALTPQILIMRAPSRAGTHSDISSGSWSRRS